MPKPTKEHEWLKQLAGEWTSECEASMPNGETMKAKGTEKAEMLGGFWLIGKGEADMMGMKCSNVLTLGYDAHAEKFVGSWVDSFTGHYWNYEGELDDSGKKLTLKTKGPCPMRPGQLSNFKEVLEIKSEDQKTLMSYIEDDNGGWQKMVTVTYRRKK